MTDSETPAPAATPSGQRRAPMPRGILDQLAGLLTTVLASLSARLELAGIEGREAATHYALILVLTIGGLILLIFGYLLSVIGVVFLIAHCIGTENAWIWVTLGAATLHFLVAGALLIAARSRLAQPMFSASLEQLKQDQEWIKPNAKPL